MWIEKENKLYQSFVFEDFLSAFAFITKVAILSETAKHHPRWTNEYNVVEIWLYTHDQNNQITTKDYDLAEKIDKLL